MQVRMGHLAFAFCLIAAMSSCQKELSYENAGGVTDSSANFTALIDGVRWTAADTAKGASLLGGLINLIGISTDNQQLSIVLNDTVTGIYVLGQNSVSTAIFSDNNSSDAYSSDQGSDTSQAGGRVTVTAIDKVNKTISGTFSFKLYRNTDGKQKTFTEGVFNKLSYISSLPIAASTDTLDASIDGTVWSAQSILASAFSGVLTVTGSNADGSEAVALLMPQDVSPGSYALDYTGFTYLATYSPAVSTGLASVSGTLEILENNVTTHRVRGNFNFQAINPISPSDKSYQLTNGYFSVKYN